MAIVDFDPQGSCEKATIALLNSMLEEGQRLAKQGLWEQSLVCMFRAYSLSPGRSYILHAIAAIYREQRDEVSAKDCQSGVVPEKAEAKYFNSTFVQKRLIAARKAILTQHHKTHRPKKSRLKAPSSNESPISRPQFGAVNTDSRGSFVSVIENGAFWFDGFNTVVVDSEDNIVIEHVKGNAFVVADIARHRPEYVIDGTICFLDSRSSHIYYHWMLDVLPKLALLESSGIRLADIDHFVVGCSSSFQEQTLLRLGVPSEKIVPPRTDVMIRSGELIVPYLKHDRGDRYYNGLGLGMADWVGDWLKSKFLYEPPGIHPRLYISRATRGTRILADEEQLVKELESRKFHCVKMEELKVHEQASLMAGADLVVAPHGAGLTNIAFCKPGTVVIEIFGDYVVPCYWALSELSMLNHHAYFVNDTNKRCGGVERAQAENNSPLHPRDQGIDLDAHDFMRYLDGVLK